MREVSRCIVPLLLAIGLSAGAGGQEAASKAAIVDVTRVLEAYSKVAVVKENIKKQFEVEQKTLQKEQKNLKLWEDKIRVDERDKYDLERFKEVQQFELAMLQFKNRMQDLAKDFEARQRSEIKVLLADIRNAVRAVATAEKCSIVLRAPEFEDELVNRPAGLADEQASTTAAELVRKFRESPVMYFAPEYDLTDRVISRLNNEYKNLSIK